MNISIILEAALLSKNYGCPWFWMPGFRIYQGYTGFWRHLNIPEQILNILDYAWICLNMADYARISVKPVVTYSNEVYGLTEHEAVFLKGQKLIFAIVARCIWFAFCFRLHICTGKISNFLLLPLLPKGRGPLIFI